MKKNSYNKKQCGTVKINILVPIVGVFCLIGFGIFLIISFIYNAETALKIILGLFFILSLFMVLTVNEKIEYTSLGFTYRDMLRINHKYNYSQVKKIRYSKDVIIQAGHRIIFIDSMADNGKKFARIAMQYSKNAVIVTDSQSKLFGGNVHSPGEFIFVYILIALIPVFLTVWALTECREINLDSLDVYSATVSDYCFDKYDEDADRLAIKFTGREEAFVTWMIDNNTQEYEAFKKDAAEKRNFDVFYFDKETDNNIIKIYQLSCGDKVYVSLEQENGNNHEMRNGVLVCSAVMLAIWLLYIAISTYVMCNAEKYPKLIKLFVKSDYIVKK